MRPGFGAGFIGWSGGSHKIRTEGGSVGNLTDAGSILRRRQSVIPLAHHSRHVPYQQTQPHPRRSSHACYRVALVQPGNTATPLSATPPSKETASIDALIDSLANRNPPPVIFEAGPGRWAPHFDPNYDWREQARVDKALRKTVEQQSLELWERLMAHAEDERYCLTFNDQAANCSEKGTNWTVGRFCGEIASFYLTYPVRQATDELHLGDGERPKYLPLGLDGESPQPPQTTFVEQQIGLCRDALAELPKVKEMISTTQIDDAMIARCRTRLIATIAELSKSKTGVFGRCRETMRSPVCCSSSAGSDLTRRLKN